MKKKNGFTLLELMITLAVFAIMTAIAVPAFTQTLNKNQALSVSYELLSDLYLARSEAIKRNLRVSICPSNNGNNCSTSWTDGWIVYQPEDNTVLAVKGKPAKGLTVTANTKIKNYISYISSGRARSNSYALQNGTFRIKQGDFEYKVIISNTGRPRLEYAGL